MNRTASRITVAAFGAVALTAGTMGVGTMGLAHADQAAPADANPIAVGHVANLGSDSLNIRQGPGLDSPVVGSIPSGERVAVLCSVQGSDVNGNPTWYRSAPSGDQLYWMSAEFIGGLDKPVVPCDQIPPGTF